MLKLAFEQLPERRFETEIIERRWAQGYGYRANLRHQRRDIGVGAFPYQLRSAPRQEAAQVMQLDLEQGQALAQVIVQFPRQADALLFLRVHQLQRQFFQVRVQPEHFHPGLLLLRDVQVHDNGPRLGARRPVFSQRRHRQQEPALQGWRMARIFEREILCRATQDGTNARGGLMRPGCDVASSVLTNVEVIGAYPMFLVWQQIHTGEAPPRLVDRDDDSRRIEQGDVRRQRVEDGRLGGSLVCTGQGQRTHARRLAPGDAPHYADLSALASLAWQRRSAGIQQACVRRV